MSRHFDNSYARYSIIDSDEGEYSADPADYWAINDDFVFDDAALVRLNHPYVTTTGRIVLGPRLIASNPTKRRLVQLYAAVRKLQMLKLAVDNSDTMEEN